MTASVLEANLGALRRAHPQLAKRVQEAVALPPSSTEPAPDIQDWCQTFVGRDAHLIAILGFGDGRHLLEAARIPTNLIRFLVFEASLGRFRWALEQTDLSALLGQPLCRFVIEPDVNDIHSTYSDLMLAIGMNDIAVGLWPSADPSDKPFYEVVMNDLVAARQRARLATESRLLQKWIAHGNGIANLAQAATSILLDDCKDACRGFPAFLVGAGPSLDRNGHLLGTVGDRGLILCVDTAYKTFVAKHIQPHIFVTLDATPFNLDHIRGSPTHPDVALAYHPAAYYQVMEHWHGDRRRFLCLDEAYPLGPILERCLDARVRFPKCANVLQVALYLANHLGCDPLILVGCDLAYPREGGRTHASDTAHSRRTSALDREESMEFEALFEHEEKVKARMMMVEGLDGAPVPTATPLHHQRVRLESDIQTLGLRVIDASAEGAAKKGATWMPLEDAIAEFATRDGIQASVLRIDSQDGRRRLALRAELEAGRASLATASEIIRKALTEVDVWLNLDSRARVDWNQVEHCEQVTVQVQQALASVDGYGSFVEPAIRHLVYKGVKAVDVEDRRPETFILAHGKKYREIYSGMLDCLASIDRIVMMSLALFE